MKQRLKKYNLTALQYSQMIYNQHNRCAICNKPAEGKTLHIDHNHSTGKVRGLLCHSCNVLLGHAKENVEVLLSAIAYLSKDRFDE